MTDDEIMLMAQKAGPLTQGPFKEWCKRFANLVATRAAALERAKCLQIADEFANADLYASMVANAIRSRGDTK